MYFSQSLFKFLLPSQWKVSFLSDKVFFHVFQCKKQLFIILNHPQPKPNHALLVKWRKLSLKLVKLFKLVSLQISKGIQSVILILRVGFLLQLQQMLLWLAFRPDLAYRSFEYKQERRIQMKFRPNKKEKVNFKGKEEVLSTRYCYYLGYYCLY